jgi:hypothetical protein
MYDSMKKDNVRCDSALFHSILDTTISCHGDLGNKMENERFEFIMREMKSYDVLPDIFAITNMCIKHNKVGHLSHYLDVIRVGRNFAPYLLTA